MRKSNSRLLDHGLIHVHVSSNWSPFVLCYVISCFFFVVFCVLFGLFFHVSLLLSRKISARTDISFFFHFFLWIWYSYINNTVLSWRKWEKTYTIIYISLILWQWIASVVVKHPAAQTQKHSHFNTFFHGFFFFLFLQNQAFLIIKILTLHYWSINTYINEK